MIATRGTGRGRRWRVATAAAAMTAAAMTAAAMAAAVTGSTPASAAQPPPSPGTATPIQHVLVVFDENVSYDHYFGTYPQATNPAGQPAFTAAPGTPGTNGLTPALLMHNPNAAPPFRLDRSQALTCDQDHNYTDEQKAFDDERMDKFVQYTSNNTCAPPNASVPNEVMGYYDGNTVTGLWNYAQHYAMSDNSFGTQFGPSTPGALDLVSGQTHGATPTGPTTGVANGSVIGDPDPVGDLCSTSSGAKVSMSGPNVGDLLNAKNVSWGWFQGGFRPAPGNANPCGSTHQNIGGVPVVDYSAHHEPFQYYPSTANLQHTPPASAAEIGHAGPANHNYDLTDLTASLQANTLPAVSFVKPGQYQDGHAGYSDPLDEQHFLVDLVNRVQRSPEWASTAIVVAYDDSDGWYDHQPSQIVNPSQSPQDALTAPGQCGTGAPVAGFQDRCGHGPRLPLLVISPYVKPNSVDHTPTDQTSITRFIEDNWLGGQRIGGGSYDALAGPLDKLFDFHTPKPAPPLTLDPQTGRPTG